MNIQALMKQAKKMQKDVEEKQAQLAQREYSDSIGGVIKMTINGDYRLLDLQIDEDFLKSENREDLQEMLMTIFNNLSQKVKKDQDELASSIKMPGLF